MNAQRWAALLAVAFGFGFLPAGAEGASQYGPPVCYSDATVFELGEQVAAGHCYDGDGDKVQIEVLESPSNGDVVVYDFGTPMIYFTGREVGTGTLRFKATNGQEESDVITAELTVYPVTNDPPECSSNFLDFGPTGFGLHHVPVGQSLSFFCNDEERDPVTYTVTRPPSLGEVHIGTGPPNNWGYFYTARAMGRDTFDMTISDGVSAPVRGTVVTYNTAALPQSQSGAPPGKPQVPATPDAVTAPALLRGASGRRLAVGSNGALPLTESVSCPGLGPACYASAVATMSRRHRSTRIASRAFRVRANAVAPLRLRISRRALRLLRHRRTIDSTITVVIRRGPRTSERRLRKTLRAPAARHRR